MQSLAFYGRLISRAVAGSVASDGCKDGIPTFPRPASHLSYPRHQPLFRFTLPFRNALLGPASCHPAATERLFSQLISELLPLPSTPVARSIQSQIRAVSSASAAAAAAAAPEVAAPETAASQRLALRLITAKCGFAKDNLPPSWRTGASPEASGRSGGWVRAVRRRLRHRDPESALSTESGVTPSVPPSAGRAACFGDDSFFVTGDSTADVLGVADGVGGWRNYGVDPSLFSSSLMANCERVVVEGRSRPDAPKTIIATGYYDLVRMSKTAIQNPSSEEASEPGGRTLMGSSTVCILSFHRETQNLYTANLGDSGFAVYRNGKVLHRSTEQQHYFNTPYQLSLPPQPQSGSMLQDSPEVAEASSVQLKEGDVILLATDGLWDNLDHEMILEEIQEHIRDPNDEESVERAARALASRARDLAFDPKYMSPFARHARAAGIHRVTGGKPDDITILLSSVSSSR